MATVLVFLWESPEVSEARGVSSDYIMWGLKSRVLTSPHMLGARDNFGVSDSTASSYVGGPKVAHKLKQVGSLFLAGAAGLTRRCRRYIFTAGDRLSSGDRLVTLAQCAVWTYAIVDRLRHIEL